MLELRKRLSRQGQGSGDGGPDHPRHVERGGVERHGIRQVCLANQIEASGNDYETAFKKYQELRYLRTARVQLMARVFGEIYHASGVNRELRNKLLSEWNREGSIDMSWLYGEQPELPKVGTIPLPPVTRLDS